MKRPYEQQGPLTNQLPSMKGFLVGSLVSFLLAWVAGAVFLDRIPPTQMDEETGIQVYPHNAPIQYRTEGWATSYNDAHGMNHGSSQGLRKRYPYMIWGDSFVQALQVDDDAKMNAVLSRLCTENNQECGGAGLGWFADTVADYYFKIQRYSKITGSQTTHIILLGQFGDILPGPSSQCRSSFQEEGQSYSFAEHLCPPQMKYQGIVHILYSLRLAAISKAISLVRKIQPVPFQKIPATIKPRPEPTKSPQIKAWNFLLDEFIKVTNGKLIFVYAPDIPQLRHSPTGTSLTTEDSIQPLVSTFQTLCSARGVPFINMRSAFAALYTTQHKFPRGFSNTVPWEGHLNENGHRLIAEAIYNHVTEGSSP